MKIAVKLLSLLLALCLLAATVPMALTEDAESVVSEPVDEAVEESPEAALPGVNAPEAQPEAPRAAFPDAGEAAPAGDSLDDATPIELGTTCTGTISSDNTADFYVFALPSSGRLTFSATAKMEYLDYFLFDASGSQLWLGASLWNPISGQGTASASIDLIGGTYYVAAKQFLAFTGDYTFSLSLESANETHAETADRMNNTADTASPATLGAACNGQLALNDSVDFYTFALPTAERLTFSATAKIEGVKYCLYDASGKELWRKTAFWNATARSSTVSAEIDLDAGTYYLAVKRRLLFTGNYSFQLLSAATPTPTVTPTPTATPVPPIRLLSIYVAGISDKTYTGKAIKPLPQVSILGKKLVRGADYTVSYENNTSIGRASVIIKGINQYTGEVTRHFNILPRAARLAKITVGKDKLTVKWLKSTGVSGYQLQYSPFRSFILSDTVTIKGASNTIRTLRKLTPKTVYYVRLRAYKKVGGTRYYSAWSNIWSRKTK